MQIVKDTGSYNDRRYGKPYIAVIDFSKNPKGDARWGDWVGQPGDAGLLVIDAEPGAIVMTGQKDFRQPKNSAPDYYQVHPDGTLGETITKAEAYKKSAK